MVRHTREAFEFWSFLLDLIPSISHLLQQKERWTCMRMDLPINEMMKYFGGQLQCTSLIPDFFLVNIFVASNSGTSIALFFLLAVSFGDTSVVSGNDAFCSPFQIWLGVKRGTMSRRSTVCALKKTKESWTIVWPKWVASASDKTVPTQQLTVNTLFAVHTLGACTIQNMYVMKLFTCLMWGTFVVRRSADLAHCETKVVLSVRINSEVKRRCIWAMDGNTKWLCFLLLG